MLSMLHAIKKSVSITNLQIYFPWYKMTGIGNLERQRANLAFEIRSLSLSLSRELSYIVLGG
jgi:hypothetical protein